MIWTVGFEHTMRLREKLHRDLHETGKVFQTRRYKWLCGIAVLLFLVSQFHVFEPEYWQMRKVQWHIAEIGPQWAAFKRANPGFEGVELLPRYDDAYGVRFSARGRAPWNVDLNQLAEFMSSTRPPFPVDISRVEGSYGISRARTFVTVDGKEVDTEVFLEQVLRSNSVTERSAGGPSN